MNRIFTLAAMTACLASAPAHAGRKTSSISSIKQIRLDYIENYIEEAASKERLEPALLRDRSTTS